MDTVAILFALLIIPLIIGGILLAIITLFVYFYKRKHTSFNQQVSFWGILFKTTVALLIVSGIGGILFIYVPTKKSDNAFIEKQKVCANQVGYESPMDDNTSNATAQSQQAYRNCLNTNP